MTVRALIYRRISADPTGRAAGVGRQEADCRALADSLGWTIVENVLTADNDVSAYSGKPRPQYRKMLEELEAGRADAVLAWHPDRLYRRLADLEEFIDIVNRHRIAVRTVQAGEMDLSGPTGRAMARTAAVWAGHEVEHAIERMRSAKAEAAAKGLFRGGPRPFGYEADGVTIRESEAREVRDAVRRLLAGEAVNAIVSDWNARGVPTARGGSKWLHRTLKDLLVRARNAGKIERSVPGQRWGEIVGDAVWPRLISDHQLTAARALLSDPDGASGGNYRNNGNDLRHLGSGLYLCGICQDPTTMKIGGSNGSKVRPTGFYICRENVHCARSTNPVDTYVLEAFGEILQRPETRLRIYDVPDVDIEGLQVEAMSIREELEELRRALGRREIKLRDFTVASAGMNADLEQVERQLQASAARSPLSGIADAEDVLGAWAAASLGRKRAVLNTLATVTLLPKARGRLPNGLYFDPASVVIAPKE